MKIIAILLLITGFIFLYSVQTTLAPNTPLFHKNNSYPSPTSTERYQTLFLTGDIMLGRTVMTNALDQQDFSFPFRLVADEMKNADITFVNLENPIIKDCPRKTEGFVFCTRPEFVQGLTYAGVDIVTLANNHSHNYGQDGITQTLSYLNDSKIEATGVNNLIEMNIDSTNFGFLGFDKSQQSSPKLTQDEVDLIKQSDPKVDTLIVAMHWGVEYQHKALPGVRALARQLVELGADVVVGHHPHWVQDWEMIGDVPVYYSLGNFIFDQMWSEKTRQGMAVKLYFQDGKFIKDEKLKTYMQNWAQPQWVN